MKKIFFILLTCLTITACTNIFKPYRHPIQQGNILTSDMMKKLKPGLTKQQVADIYGQPVLNNLFDQNTWVYIYTFLPSTGAMQEKRLIINFKNDRVANYAVLLPPPQKTHKKWL